MDYKLLINETDMGRAMERLAYEIMEKHGDCEDVQIIGIERRGVNLAKRLQDILQNRLGRSLPLGTLDINLYRDDWTSMESSPKVGPSRINADVNGACILLVDDVIYTGRTIRSAMEAIMDYGRPSRVELLVLVDRGRRELPMQPDYVGRRLNTAANERVDVLLKEHDGKDEVVLTRMDE